MRQKQLRMDSQDRYSMKTARTAKATRSTMRQDLGQARILGKRRVEAGSLQEVRFLYRVGHPIDDSGSIKIAFRAVGDFGAPQLVNPKQRNFCSVTTTGDCRIEPRWDPKGHTRPWDRTLFLKVTGGFLDSGDEVLVVFGDRSQGSAGWQVQSFCESTFEFKTLVDPIASFQFRELPESPVLRIVPGPPVRAVCIAPSQVEVGRPFTCRIRLEDRWGNAVRAAVRRRGRPFNEPGVHTVRITDQRSRLTAESNPIQVGPRLPAKQHFWADFHGQSEESIGTNSAQDYFAYARDRAVIDICGHQANDFQITDNFWALLNSLTAHFNRPGEFVTIPGYEWSGNTPLGGDRNVFYARENGPLYRSCRELIPDGQSQYPDAPTVEDLYRRLRNNGAAAPFMFAHVGGRYADISRHDPELEVAVEVHSAWGTFQWIVDEALRRGQMVGICANSDGHKGRPGASYPGAGIFGSLGGLTCVLAPRLDRQCVIEAIRARHIYATSGHRPLLSVEMHDSGGSIGMMGDLLEVHPNDRLTLRVQVHGTAPLEVIEVRNRDQVIKKRFAGSPATQSCRYKLTWSGAKVRGRDRMVNWDGELRLHGNQILSCQPVNFWNPERPIENLSSKWLRWQSVTTGGAAGMILELEHPGGRLEMMAGRHSVSCDLARMGPQGRKWACGGLEQEITLRRLSNPPAARDILLDVPLAPPAPGLPVDAYYVRVLQEDDHLAWSSPIFVRGRPGT